MKGKQLKTKTINNNRDNLIPTNLTEYGDYISKNSVKTKEIMRCHICCKNFSTEEYYFHKKQYHVLSKNTDSSTNYTFYSKNKKVSNTKKIVSSTKMYQKINYNNIKKPDITTKVNKKVPLKGGYDDWKCCLCPSLIIDGTALLHHVKTYHQSTESCFPVRQFWSNDNIPVLHRKFKNYAGVVEKRWSHSITEHIRAVLDFKLNVRMFECEFCRKSCMDPDHFEIHQWSRSSMMFKVFECTMCSKSFKTQTQLDMHTSLHI